MPRSQLAVYQLYNLKKYRAGVYYFDIRRMIYLHYFIPSSQFSFIFSPASH